jgi:hypothetical protein
VDTQELDDRKTTNALRAGQFAILAMLFLFVFTHRTIQGQNTLSRFVGVESLVQHGTLYIDDSPWMYKVERDGARVWFLNDMVRNPLDGHYYSSKPPVLTLILAGVLWPFKLLGADLKFTGAEAAIPVFILTWFVIGSVSACGFYAFRRKVGAFVGGREADLVTVLTLGGTLFLTYSVTMNHHTFTAALVLISFFLLGMAEAEPKVGDGRAGAAGLLMGLATVVDIGPGFIFSVAFALYIVFYQRSLRALIMFGIWSISPLAVHCVVQDKTFGSILPVQMIEGTKDYPGSYWKSMLAPDTWQVSRYRYWLLTLFSGRGLFVVSPILLAGASALARDIFESARPAEGDRAEAGRGYVALTVLFAILFLVAYDCFMSPTNFCGSSFGFRYYIGFTPILAFYAARSYARFRKSAAYRAVFYALGLVSLMYALIGMQHPWTLMENNPHPAVRFLMLLRGM